MKTMTLQGLVTIALLEEDFVSFKALRKLSKFLHVSLGNLYLAFGKDDKYYLLSGFPGYFAEVSHDRNKSSEPNGIKRGPDFHRPGEKWFLKVLLNDTERENIELIKKHLETINFMQIKEEE